MIPLCGPVSALECFGRCGAAGGGGLKDGALRTGGRFAVARFANEAGGGKLLQRIVNLRPRNGRPIANVAPLHLQVGFVAMHGALSQKTEEHKIRNGQYCLFLRSHRYLASGVLCALFCERLRSRLQYHH